MTKGQKTLQKQLSTNMRTYCQQCTIKTTQLQGTGITHEIIDNAAY